MAFWKKRDRQNDAACPHCGHDFDIHACRKNSVFGTRIEGLYCCPAAGCLCRIVMVSDLSGPTMTIIPSNRPFPDFVPNTHDLDLVGKYVSITIDYQDSAGSPMDRLSICGKIISIGNQDGLVLSTGHKNELKLPPLLALFEAAPQGTMSPAGDPIDFVAEWVETISPGT